MLTNMSSTLQDALLTWNYLTSKILPPQNKVSERQRAHLSFDNPIRTIQILVYQLCIIINIYNIICHRKEKGLLNQEYQNTKQVKGQSNLVFFKFCPSKQTVCVSLSFLYPTNLSFTCYHLLLIIYYQRKFVP